MFYKLASALLIESGCILGVTAYLIQRYDYDDQIRHEAKAAWIVLCVATVIGLFCFFFTLSIIYELIFAATLVIVLIIAHYWIYRR